MIEKIQKLCWRSGAAVLSQKIKPGEAGSLIRFIFGQVEDRGYVEVLLAGKRFVQTAPHFRTAFLLQKRNQLWRDVGVRLSGGQRPDGRRPDFRITISSEFQQKRGNVALGVAQ